MLYEVITDAPGEWFIDKVHKKLYAYLPDSVNEESEIRMNQSDQVMIRFKGTRYITLQGINIDGTRSTAVDRITSYNVCYTKLLRP